MLYLLLWIYLLRVAFFAKYGIEGEQTNSEPKEEPVGNTFLYVFHFVLLKD